MFPRAGLPVGPEYSLVCIGGLKSHLGEIKSCKYFQKYFFVFLSIQFLSIVFPKHCKFTANHKLICFKLLYISSHILISWMRGVYSNSSMDPFPESGWGSCASPAPGSFPSAPWGRVLHLRGSSFLSLDRRAIHSRDAQYQSLFGLLHSFLCPALLWLEGHWGFNYLTI